MFDSVTIARQLTEAGIDPAQAEALAEAIRQVAEHGAHSHPPPGLIGALTLGGLGLGYLVFQLGRRSGRRRP